MKMKTLAEEVTNPKILNVDPGSIWSTAQLRNKLTQDKVKHASSSDDIQIHRSSGDCDRMTRRHLSGLSHGADTEAEAAGSSPLSLSQPKSNTHHVQQTSISTAHSGSHAHKRPSSFPRLSNKSHFPRIGGCFFNK